MTRFFIRPDQIDADTVILDSDDALHLDRVLRAKIGDEIGVLDGSGRMTVARLTALSKSHAAAVILRTEDPKTEPEVRVTIAQALPKTAEKLEWVLQHAVEAGAAGFIVFRSRRSEAGKLAEKPQRWEKIVKTAAEQSGRTRLPAVESCAGLSQVLNSGRTYDIKLFCDEAEQEQTLRKALTNRSPSRILLIVGPEGGWTDDERETAIAGGALPITLGPRTLRTETAALVALSQIIYALDTAETAARRQS
jgi:16S rRNA (uracil1498-N3)-methyltransferase